MSRPTQSHNGTTFAIVCARWIGAACLFLAALPVPAAPAPSIPDAERLFAVKIQPLMKEKCLACHGEDPKGKIKGGLDMRTATAFLKGGDSGQSPILKSDPDKSPLLRAVGRKDEDFSAMPPKDNDKLTDEQVNYLRLWVAAGAPWPSEQRLKELASAPPTKNSWDDDYGVAVHTSGGLADSWTNRKYKPENLWAYQPLKTPPVPTIAGAQPKNPIDAFINKHLNDLGLQPAPPADRRTLIRRATYDLTGLPPTPDEIDAFLNDPQPDDAAFSKVIDRLLASPHYGEQYGRHWLDVVRYADTSGLANDFDRGNAWRYRDYVVRAFNDDKPYDQFMKQQVAGDEIDPKNPENLIAVGFLRSGPWELTGMEVAKVARQRFLDDVTDAVGQTFLATAMQCCRCHDHKFDPIPTRDYYSLQAVFATTQFAERQAAFLPTENTSGFDEKKYLDARRAYYLKVLDELSEKSIAAARQWYKDKHLDPTDFEETLQAVKSAPARKGKKGRQIAAATAAPKATKTGANAAAINADDSPARYSEVRRRLMASGLSEDQIPPRMAGFTPQDFGVERIARKGLERLTWEFDRYKPLAFSVYDGRTPEVKSMVTPHYMPADRLTTGELEKTCILAGGDPFSPKDPVTPGVLSMISNPPVPTTIEGRRTALANWLADKSNPLPPRVIANRLWLWHFNQPIAGNPNNFGATGIKPTHPELLDYLATRLIDSGWSIKSLHRLIMTSDAYRRSSDYPDPKALAEKDKDNDSYAAFKPRRLAAEEMRDSALSVASELNPQIGGIPARPEINLEAAMQPRQVMGTFASAYQPNPLSADRHRRSIYSLHVRGLRDPFMEVFNQPSPDLSCERRDASTVTPQVFSLFNSQSSYQDALAFAARVLNDTKGQPRDATIAQLFRLSYGRLPTPEETTLCLRHWDQMTTRHRTITFVKPTYPKEIIREAVEENTGEKFTFAEPLETYADFTPDLQPSDTDPETRGLAEVCLVILNSNEFVYVY